MRYLVALLIVSFSWFAHASQCKIFFTNSKTRAQYAARQARSAVNDRAVIIWDKIKRNYIRNLVARGEYINRDDPNGYLTEFLKTNDNAETVKKGLHEPLKGFDKHIEEMTQHVSGTNENGEISSWYKAFESGDYKTHPTILTILYKDEVRPADYDQAIKNIEGWIEAKRRLPEDLRELTREGFEAFYQEKAYRAALRKYNREMFSEYSVRYDGLPVEVPFYSIDPVTKQIVSEIRTIPYYKIDVLLDHHRDAQKTTERIFGNKTNPIDLVVNAYRKRRKFQIRLYGNLDYLLGTVYRVPLGIFGNIVGTVKVGLGSLRWLVSLATYKGENGEFFDRLVEQAMLRRRLDMAIQAFAVREEREKEPLDEIEKILFDDAIDVLLDPNLVPRSDAVKKASLLELDAENSMSTGFNIDKQNKDDLPDVAKTRDHSKYAHYRSQTKRVAGVAMQYAKTYGVRIVMTSILAAGAVGYLKKGSDSILDQPYISYPLSVVREGGYNIMSNLFGFDAMVSSNVRDVYDPKDFYTNSALKSFVEGTESFRHEARLNGNTDYLENPELVKKGDDILRAHLHEIVDQRKVEQRSYVVDRMSDVIIPEYATDIMAKALMAKYPKHKRLIMDVFSKMKQEVLKDGFMALDLSELNARNELFRSDIPEQLYKDMRYLLRPEGSFSSVVNYMLMNGPMVKSDAAMYKTFLEAPKNYLKLDSTLEVRFTHDLNFKNALGADLRGEYVIIKSEPNKDGLVEVEFLNPEIPDSPTGSYFAPITSLH